eukprot:1873772-Heterocapsa_arctica.AAC.1
MERPVRSHALQDCCSAPYSKAPLWYYRALDTKNMFRTPKVEYYPDGKKVTILHSVCAILMSACSHL